MANTTWVTPRTWVAGELVTAAIMNAHVRDELNALKTPASDVKNLTIGTDTTTTSTSFVDIDSTNLAITFTTGGGDCMVGFTGTVSIGGTYRVLFNVMIDGADAVATDGLVETAAATGAAVGFVYLATGLSAASHTFKLRWKVSGGTATFYRGAGTAGYDVHPQMWVREVS